MVDLRQNWPAGVDLFTLESLYLMLDTVLENAPARTYIFLNPLDTWLMHPDRQAKMLHIAGMGGMANTYMQVVLTR